MSTPTPTELPPLHGRYRILDRLGSSRLAVVYSAYDERLQRHVLVHLMRRDLANQATLRERFRKEAEHHAARTHHSLLDVYDSGELAGRPFIITEYVSGRALRDLGALSLEDALLYMRQIVGAVAVCQEVGAPHPPISSANVIVVDDGHVELLESWQIAPEDVARDIACYRPPERTAGAPVTPAGAVYSLGILLIELLSGKRPIDGTDAQQIAQAHINARIPSIADLQPRLHSRDLELLLSQATARDPQQRIPNAAALAQQIDALYTKLSGDTQRFLVREQPSMGDRVRSETGRLMRAPAIRKRLPSTMQPDNEPASLSVGPPPRRAALGLAIMGVLFFAVVCGAYQLGTLAVERLANIRLPRIELPASSIGVQLPDWVTGDVAGDGELFEIAISAEEGLNLRSAPGLNTQVVTLLPNGTRVRRIDGPQIVDGVPWMKVRARMNNRDVEGWVSANYMRQV